MKMKKWIIVISLIIVFCISVLCGFMIKSYINFSKKDSVNIAILADNSTKENSIDTSYYEQTVSPNCEVVMVQKYKKCGHSITQREEAPREIINLNKDKVQEYYNGWNIDSFKTDEIVVSRDNPGICEEHYILRESDGYISISTKNDIGEYIFKGLTDISVQYLPEDDLKKLEHGIEIVGRDNLNSFLEDFE